MRGNGVVEGFYGKPYTVEMRRGIFRALAVCDDPVYLYAPKDDPFHRREWRKPYPSLNWSEIEASIALASEAGVAFYFGLSPWKFDPGEHGPAREKLRIAAEAGASGLCILFDDIPRTASGELAVTQLAFAERATSGLNLPVMLCPTVYCRDFLRGNPGASEYLESWRNAFDPLKDVLWTGNEVVSRELGGLGEACDLLGKAPVIWDNLLADDYCLRRVYLGSMKGRAPRGTPVLLNPSCIFPVAMHGVMELAAAATGRREWPVELGPELRGWELLRDFNFTPWEVTGTGERILGMLGEALSGGEPGPCLAWLERALGDMEEMADSVGSIPGGWDLYPFVRDMWRTLSILRKALLQDGPSARGAMLHYLMYRRLPYENPLAALAAHPREDEV
ncbi:MAG: beta-N-acetylglucosaminidase domain-containing protein [Candidatus Fermentibacteraceae bacterium]